MLHRFFLLSYRLPFAVCGHHLSPRIAIVFSLSSVPNSSMSHLSIFLISSNTSRSSQLYFTFSHYVSSTLLLCHKGTPLHLLPPLDYWYISFFFLGGGVLEYSPGSHGPYLRTQLLLPIDSTMSIIHIRRGGHQSVRKCREHLAINVNTQMILTFVDRMVCQSSARCKGGFSSSSLTTYHVFGLSTSDQSSCSPAENPNLTSLSEGNHRPV